MLSPGGPAAGLGGAPFGQCHEGYVMDADRTPSAVNPAAREHMLTMLANLSAQVAAGQFTGILLIAVEPDGSAVRHLAGSAMADRHHACGLATQLALDVLRTN